MSKSEIAQSRIDRALTEPTRPNPIASAIIFSHLTAAHQGATMNVHNHEFTGVGDKGYGVGGMRSEITHRRVPTTYRPALADGSPRPDVVLDELHRVKRHFPKNSEANLGSWSEGGHLEFDASQVVHDRDRAVRMGRRRGEKAIFDYPNGRDIRLRG